MQKKYASDRHKAPRKMLWVPQQEWLHFEKVITQLRQRTKVDDLQYGQAFKLVLKAAEKHLNVGSGIRTPDHQNALQGLLIAPNTQFTRHSSA